jgi:VWFA-related protein
MRWLFAAFFFVAAGSAHAQWLALDDALAKARAERKPVLVFLRANCTSCNKNADNFIESAETHEAIVRAYGPFIRARAEADRKLLAQKAPAPSLLIVDPSGAYVVAWKDWFSLSRYLNFLRLARDEATNIVAASTLHAKDEGEADILLAGAAIHTLMFERARDLFRRSRDDFQKRGNAEREQYAQMGYDLGDFLTGDYKRAHDDLSRTVQAATTPRNRAYGYFNLAMMNLLTRDTAGAVRAYREVLAAAPAESDEALDARAVLEGLGVLEPQPVAKQEALIQVVAPPRATVTGHAEFSAKTASDVKRVAWFVDQVAIASSDHPPFTERLNLGDTPRKHSIGAVAYNASGDAIAEAVATINDRIDFRVALVSPVATVLSGKTIVEASVEAPPDHAVKNVELFWNKTKLGTFTAPPYRADFDAPSAFGYFRALATLDDGRIAEETHVVNSPAVGETLDVHTIAFAATVKDRHGQRVNGLAASDFRATDSGEPVALKVRDEEEPVTIGLAIDASASMRVMLLDTIETAWSFANAVVSPRDRVFLVAFDSRPHLLESPTTDRDALKSAIFDILPSGGTAIVDALAFSLQQFTGLTGKKALVMITDAREGSSSQTSEAAARMARESGVPIYVLVPRGGKNIMASDPDQMLLRMQTAQMLLAQHSGTRSTPMPSTQPFIDTMAGDPSSPLTIIANASGGLVFFAPGPEEQTAIFVRIRDEVRGQYLLSFVSHATKAGVWRDLHVAVDRSNATVRTIAGYYAK